MFEQVLVPVDGSAASAAALLAAFAVAPTDAAVHVCYVATSAERLNEGECCLSDAKDVARAMHRTVTLTVLDGGVRNEILRWATVTGADLIVMGTHGRSGVRRLLLGSVTEGVLRGTSIPVLTVREGTRPPVLSRLFVAIDRSPESVAAADFAFRLAEERGASVVIGHAIDFNVSFLLRGLSEPVPNIAADLEREGNTLLATTAARAKRRDITAELLGGESVSQINAAAVRCGADTVIVGTHGRSGLYRIAVGSTSEGVLRTSAIPVLVIHRPR